MYIPLLEKLALVGFLLMLTETVQGASRTTLPLHAFGVKNSTVVINVDIDILVPSLSSIELSDENLEPIIPYVDSEEGKALLRELNKHKELSLGSGQVYFYLAINHALARIYHSLVLQGSSNYSNAEKERLAELDRRFGHKPDDEFRNLRDLVEILPLRGKTLILDVFLSKTKFDYAAKAIGLHSTKAFWDPRLSRIGFYFDGTVFKWYKDRTLREEQANVTTALQVRDYVGRQALDSIAHELVHFIQYANGNFLGNRPFLAEAAALLIQSQIALREEITRLAAEHLRRNLPEIPVEGSPCLAFWQALPPFFSSFLARFQQGVEAARKGIALERILLLSNDRFYSQDASSLKAQYDAALAFALFASRMPRVRFERDLAPLLRGQYKATDKKVLKRIAVEFKQWADSIAAAWWDSPSADSVYEGAKGLTTLCLKNRDFVSAYMGSAVMYAVNPRSPTPFLYSGDVFFRLNIPFYAFDFYALSHAWRERFGVADESAIRIDSRLGDAFEAMGDIESALEWYSKIEQMQRSEIPPHFAITFFRSKLKLEFYRKALTAGYVRKEKVFYLMNSLVDQFQGGECSKTFNKKLLSGAEFALKENEITEYWEILNSNYSLVLEEMRAVMTSNNLDEMWKARVAYCSSN